MPTKAKVSGAWNFLKDAFAKVSGTWETGKVLWAKVSQEWKVVHSLIPPTLIILVPYSQTAHAESLGWSICDGTDGKPDLMSEKLYVRVASAPDLTPKGDLTHGHADVSVTVANTSHWPRSSGGKTTYGAGTGASNHGHDTLLNVAIDDADNEWKTEPAIPYIAYGLSGTQYSMAKKIPSGSFFFTDLDLSANTDVSRQSLTGSYFRLESNAGGSYGDNSHTHPITDLDVEETSSIYHAFVGRHTTTGPMQNQTHKHQLGVYESTGVQSDGPYYDLDIYAVLNDLSEPPVGFMSFFAVTSTPDGWGDFAAANGRFVRGAASFAAIGASGDNSLHTHPAGTIGNTDPDELASGAQVVGITSATSGTYNHDGHTHPLNMPASDQVQMTPRHIEMRLLRRNS